MFHEICIYEAKVDKQEEIEQLIHEVKEFYLSQPGVIDAFYIKRTHRQKDFDAAKEGESPVRMTHYNSKVTYVLHWILDSKETHAFVSKLGLEKYYKRWTKYLTTVPKSILGELVE